MQSKRILVERATSMTTKIQTFAKETYGGFMTQEQIDAKIKDPMDSLIARVGYVISQMDVPSTEDNPNPYYIPDEEYKEEIVDRMKNQHKVSREELLSSAIGQAVELVGEEVARQVARQVFGFKDTELAFGLLPRKRGVVSGLFGAAKSLITGGR